MLRKHMSSVPSSADTQISEVPSIIEHFFSNLFGSSMDNGWIVIWNKQTKLSTSHCGPLSPFCNQIVDARRTGDYYFCLTLQTQAPDTRSRGNVQMSCWLPALVFDLDFGPVGHSKKQLPRNSTEADSFIAQLPLPPSWTVSTGGGYHLYYLLPEPVNIIDPQQREYWAAISNQFHARLIQLALEHAQWQLDNCSSLTQLFRVPGTLNHKHKLPLAVQLNPPAPQTPTRYSLTLLIKAFQLQLPATAANKASGKKTHFSADYQKILEGCLFLRHCCDDAASLPEPEWHAMLSVVAHSETADQLAHELSSNYSHYNQHETSSRLHTAQQHGPFSCAAIQQRAGLMWCADCPHQNRINSPIALGLTERHRDWIYVQGTGEWYNQTDGHLYRQDLFNNIACSFTQQKDSSHIFLRLGWPQTVLLPTYWPGQQLIVVEDEQRKLNLWKSNPALEQQHNVNSSSKAIDQFTDHINYLFPESKDQQLLLDYFAHLVQFPAEKIQFALLIQGLPGTGKSVLGEILASVLGLNNVGFLPCEILHEPYTDWVERYQLIIIEEVMARGRLEFMNKMKPLITQTRINLRRMYTPIYQVRNRTNFLLFTNYPDSIIIDRTDRRYCVLQSPAQPEAPAYYAELVQLRSGHERIFYDFFKAHSLNKFNAYGQAPFTAAKQRLIEACRTPLTSTLDEYIECEEFPFHTDIINTMDCLPHLVSTFSRLAPRQLGESLRELGCYYLGPCQLPGGGGVRRLWIVRHIDLWKNASNEVRGTEYRRWFQQVKPRGQSAAATI